MSSLHAATSLEGKDVINMSYQQGRKHKSQKYSVEMTIFNEDGKKRVRYFDLKKRYENKDDSYSLIEFYKPASVKGTKLLTIDENDVSGKSQKKQWLYLPILGSIRMVESSERSDSFMNSHFSYEDISGRSPNVDNHTLVKEDSNFYYIVSIPKNKAESDYAQLNIIVDKKSLIAVKIDFYNSSKNKIKTLTNKNIAENEGMFVAMESEMEDHLLKGRTIISVSDVSLKEEMDRSLFSIKSLK